MCLINSAKKGTEPRRIPKTNGFFPSYSFVNISPSSLDYTSKEETQTLTVESNDKWALQVTYKQK